MRLMELFASTLSPLGEAPKEISIKEVKHGAWTIRAKVKPEADGKTFKAMGSHPRNSATPIATGGSTDEAVDAVITAINELNASQSGAITASRATVDYNAAFTNQIIKDNSEFSTGVTGVRFINAGGPTLVICGAEFLDAMGDDAFGQGPDQFTKLHTRQPGSGSFSDGGSSVMYCSMLTGKQVQSLGLQPNGRYTLQYDGHDRENGHLYFKLVFDSIVANKSERVRMSEPGLTIAM